MSQIKREYYVELISPWAGGQKVPLLEMNFFTECTSHVDGALVDGACLLETPLSVKLAESEKFAAESQF